MLLAVFQVYRDRWHTWSETFFLFACFFAGFYGLSDWFLFNVDWIFSSATTATAARFAAEAGFASIALAELFFLLFTFVYVDRMRRGYWLLGVVAIGLLVLIVGGLIEDVTPPPPGGLWLPVFNLGALGVYMAYVVAYGVTGVWNLLRVYRIVKKQSGTLARRAGGLVVAFTLVMFFGVFTNGYLGLRENREIPPPFSSLLLIVVLVAGWTLYPGSRERLSVAIRRFMARRYEIKATFLTFQDGTLIAAKAKPGESGVDQDVFSATLDVIQNFMRTSFPILRGTSLRTIEHGDYRIIIERGRRCYLTIVLSGEENDLLRRQMRDELLAFEAANQEALRHWRGVPSEATGADVLLQRMFEPGELFAR
ncbi:MAG: hypothetical protein A3K65_01595 [Euryarchaeota archaeon RBG_16_68_12]|nr:MAG: hypothetical protein A3K65_01595 [Euryarchaeota archaeon RBG_16_68_12]